MWLNQPGTDFSLLTINVRFWGQSGHRAGIAVRPALTLMRRSIFLSPVAKIAVARALHDGLCARQLYVGTKTFGKREVLAAD